MSTEPAAPVARLAGVTKRYGAAEALRGVDLEVREVVELVRAHYDDPAPTRELLGQLDIAHLAERQTGGPRDEGAGYR